MRGEAGDGRVRDLGDYPAKVFSGPLRFPKEKEWPDPNWHEDAATGINFGGHFTHVIINCGIACNSVWVVDRTNGRMIRPPEGEEDVEHLSIETRPNSSLMKVFWVTSPNNGSGEISPPCFKQDFIWTGTAFRALAKRIEVTCPPEVTQ